MLFGYIAPCYWLVFWFFIILTSLGPSCHWVFISLPGSGGIPESSFWGPVVARLALVRGTFLGFRYRKVIEALSSYIFISLLLLLVGLYFIFSVGDGTLFLFQPRLLLLSTGGSTLLVLVGVMGLWHFGRFFIDYVTAVVMGFLCSSAYVRCLGHLVVFLLRGFNGARWHCCLPRFCFDVCRIATAALFLPFAAPRLGRGHVDGIGIDLSN